MSDSVLKFLGEEDLLLEGQNEDRADRHVENFKQMLLNELPYEEHRYLVTDGYIDDEYAKLKEFVKKYSTDKRYPEAKNMKHLSKLVEFLFIPIIKMAFNVDLEGVQRVYKMYFDSGLSKSVGDLSSFSSLEDLEQESEMYDAMNTKKEKYKYKEAEDKPVYEDHNVVVYLGDSKEKCIKYGKGASYGFCISRTDASNLFTNYASRGATFYFVNFKTPIPSKTNRGKEIDLLVIHVYKDGSVVATEGIYSNVNSDFDTSFEYLRDNYPGVGKVIDSGVLEYKEIISDEDKEVMKYVQDHNIFGLNTPKLRLKYLELGGMLGGGDIQRLRNDSKKKHFEVFMKTFVEVPKAPPYSYGIYENIVNEIPKEMKERYKEQVRRVVYEAVTSDNPEIGISSWWKEIVPISEWGIDAKVGLLTAETFMYEYEDYKKIFREVKDDLKIARKMYIGYKLIDVLHDDDSIKKLYEDYDLFKSLLEDPELIGMFNKNYSIKTTIKYVKRLYPDSDLYKAVLGLTLSADDVIRGLGEGYNIEKIKRRFEDSIEQELDKFVKLDNLQKDIIKNPNNPIFTFKELEDYHISLVHKIKDLVRNSESLQIGFIFENDEEGIDIGGIISKFYWFLELCVDYGKSISSTLQEEFRDFLHILKTEKMPWNVTSETIMNFESQLDKFSGDVGDKYIDQYDEEVMNESISTFKLKLKNMFLGGE